MRARTTLSMLALLAMSCGGPDKPFLDGAPKPDKAAAGGAFAAVAAAAALADAEAAQRRPEKRDEVEKKPIEVKENVPRDVFDRIEAKPASTARADAGVADAPARDAAVAPPTGTPPAGPVDLRLKSRD